MKTLMSFSMIALLFVLGCSKSNDVSVVNPNGNQLKSASPDRVVPMYYTEKYPNTPTGKLTAIPVICDGVTVDHLVGTLDAFCRMFGNYDPNFPEGTTGDLAHFQSQWMIHSYSGTLTSTSGSGEVFKVQGTKKMDVIEKVFTFHLNINGNLSNHYILYATGTNANYPVLSYTFTIEKAVCAQSTGN